MAWILLRFEVFPTFETANGRQAMPHQNTVIHSLLKAVPRGRFDRIVSEHRGDYQDRRLSFWSQFAALIYAQLSGAQSLRDLVTGLGSHSDLLYHLGVGEVRRSTLADANRDRPIGIFAAVFDLLLPQAIGNVPREAKDLVRLIDSTSVRLSRTLSDWAHYKLAQAGAKLHLTYDPSAICPIYFSITPMRVNDIVEGRKIPIQPGATYVFDLGYYDYGWWAELDRLGCLFVTRLKTNTPLDLVAELPIAEGSTILSDRIGYLPERQARSRRNPFQDPVREICVLCENGKTLRLICNDLDAPAEEIAKLYKTRWQIELFFKWTKQNLRIKKFLGNSENAVKAQIITALIAFLLVRITHRSLACQITLQDLARRLSNTLLHRKRLTELVAPHKRPRPSPDPQLCLTLARS
jgi:hypothetical protein